MQTTAVGQDLFRHLVSCDGHKTPGPLPDLALVLKAGNEYAVADGAPLYATGREEDQFKEKVCRCAPAFQKPAHSGGLFRREGV